MGFDQNDTQPILQPKKRTTKVNFFVVLGVLLFLTISVVTIRYMTSRNSETVPSEVAPDR